MSAPGRPKGEYRSAQHAGTPVSAGHTTLVTGVAGFIGMHVAQALLARGEPVLGIDNLNSYYSPALKQGRLAQLQGRPGFGFERLDIAEPGALQALLAGRRITRVVHLAAQAGVRHSVSHPHDYAQANLVGFLNLLEACRHRPVQHLVYASSSSVYGGNTQMPFAETQSVDRPVSLYAATKKANELMAHSYSHLYGLPATGLRFFTVYGPWGRPDMAAWQFTQAIEAGEPITLYNHGRMSRDFTYVDDTVAGVLAVLARPPAEPGVPPWRVLNIGSHAPVPLLQFVQALELALGRKAQLRYADLQPGDVPATYADVSALQALTGQAGPATTLALGVQRFVQWYRAWHAGEQRAAA